jgi:hypothetical protein
MFLIPAMLAMVAQPVSARNVDGTVRGSLDGTWMVVGVALTLLIGLRYEVGGDWTNYLFHLNTMEGKSFAYALSRSEFSHWVIYKVMFDLGFGLTGANLFYALIFSTGIVAFARVQPRPWLVIACAVPYLITVVAMGYSRQSVAMGFAFLGLVSLRRGRYVRFGIWVLAGATFHNSAALLIPMAGLTATRSRLKMIALLGLMSFVGYEILLADKLTHLFEVYINKQLASSQGALIRLSMNAVAALAFLNYSRMFSLAANERLLWSLTSLVAIAMIIVYFITGLSTALDRMALYLIPLQLVTVAHLPDAFRTTGHKNSGIIFAVLTVFFGIQFVWLNFASHAEYWLPYKMGIAQ